MNQLKTSILLFHIFCCLTTFSQNNSNNEYWLSFVDSTKNKCGYLNTKGDTVIQADNNFCFTDTFRNYAIVLNKNSQFVAINRRNDILYNVFPFDNGPDYASDGLFRIIKNNKIGYADDLTGKIIIKPHYGCAFPFKKGVTKVGIHCKNHADKTGHYYWTTNNWIYINKKGKNIKL